MGDRVPNGVGHSADRWLILSLGEKRNWESLTEEERTKLRKTQRRCVKVVYGLVFLLMVMSMTLLLSGGKTGSLTSALAIIGAVFPAVGRFLSKPIEHYYSAGESFEAARLRVIEGYLNVLAALLAVTALLDLIAAVLFGKW